jgi:glycosyltransferase involved in cell wall biosynthesis
VAAGWVTVALPIRNGERYLDEVLGAVRRQRVDRELELLIVDSGSTDRTLDIARMHGARIHEIPPESFSHGGTRNLIMELARGDHVAFLTDDATPAHDDWLQAMLDSFGAAEDVALAWGPQRPRAGAPLAVKAELRRWFANWEHADGSVDVQRLERSSEALAAYESQRWRWQFFSDVNSCVARWAWERIPFQPVPIAEDQVIGREMIEAGFAKVFHPRAAVYHSHDFPPWRFFQRYFEEYRGLRETLGVVHPPSLRQGAGEVIGLLRQDRAYLRDVEGLSRLRSLPRLAPSLRHHSLRLLGAALGSRADRLPAAVRRTLSIEGRDTFAPYSRPPSGPAP